MTLRGTFQPTGEGIQGDQNGGFRVRRRQNGLISSLAANDALLPASGSAILRGDRPHFTQCGHSQSIQRTSVGSILVGGVTARRYEDD